MIMGCHQPITTCPQRAGPRRRGHPAATATLAAAGLPSPRADAEQLAAHVLGLPRSRLVLAPALSPVQAERLSALVTARAERVPLQHLTGVAAFHHIDVPVGPGVFVPRPETNCSSSGACGRPAR